MFITYFGYNILYFLVPSEYVITDVNCIRIDVIRKLNVAIKENGIKIIDKRNNVQVGYIKVLKLSLKLCDRSSNASDMKLLTMRFCRFFYAMLHASLLSTISRINGTSSM